MKPVIIINLKTYQQGKKSVEIAKKISRVDKKIIIGAQASDIFEICKVVKNPIFVEHVDYQLPGRNTGFILPEAVKADRAKGVFLNHSEHKLKFDVIKKTVLRCKKLKLKTAIFASSLSEAKKIKKLKPDYLIYEPPELVGGKKSVSLAKPEIIKKIHEKLNYDLLVGAGIKTNEDLKIAMKLGAKGIAVSSGITKARDVEKALKKLLGN
ncbi:MAG: triose-phosphate isomerase [Candidatus Pacearchaeota archaeon]|jgi:triosephosphate isomerase